MKDIYLKTFLSVSGHLIYVNINSLTLQTVLPFLAIFTVFAIPAHVDRCVFKVTVKVNTNHLTLIITYLIKSQMMSAPLRRTPYVCVSHNLSGVSGKVCVCVCVCVFLGVFCACRRLGDSSAVD